MTTPKTLSAIAALSLWASSLPIAAATIVTPDDWFAHYSSNRGDRIENGDTGSPTYHLANSGNPRSMSSVWSYFENTTLVDGGSLTLSTQLRINYTTNVSRAFDVFRFGIFKSDPANKATTETFGVSRYASELPGNGLQTTNWTGFMLSVGQSSNGDVSSQLYRRNPGNHIYPTTTTGSITMGSLEDGLELPEFPHNTPISLTVTFSRSGDDLIVSGTLGDNSFAGTYAGAFIDYDASFDTLGFWSSNTNPTTNISTISFENTTITVIPEPGATALGLLVLGGFATYQISRRTARGPTPRR